MNFIEWGELSRVRRTLEIDHLDVPASRGYDGEYQGRKTFTGQELDSVIGFKGHALTDVVKGFEDIRTPA